MTGKELDLENLPNDDDEQWFVDFYVHLLSIFSLFLDRLNYKLLLL